MDIGFIGLGLMGRAMAANLLKAGHEVRVWNRSPAAADEMAKLGATRVATAAEAFRGDAVITMLANDEAVRATLIDGGLLDAARGTVHVNAATISAALSKELTALHKAAGVGYIAAPVFGRPDVAEAGKLNIVAAGAPDALARVQPLLDAMGQKTWAVGDDPVRANVVKIAGNFMIAAAIETMGEATALCRSYGVETEAFLDILTNTLFASPVFKGYGAIISEKRYEPAGFPLPLGFKDVGLALKASEEAHVPMPFAGVLRDSFLDALAQGNPDKDWASIAEVAHRRAGLKD
ncbi:MAG TPA: NAD(P)-dependent oxidoreductase [Parvibaculum sp.]|jgi:3-hydroxyisobutyrate dehydrogenase-like beta-hydroxyacid dehydrogenase